MIVDTYVKSREERKQAHCIQNINKLIRSDTSGFVEAIKA